MPTHRADVAVKAPEVDPHTGECLRGFSKPVSTTPTGYDPYTMEAYAIFRDYNRPGLVGFLRRIKFEALGGPLYYKETSDLLLDARQWRTLDHPQYGPAFQKYLNQPGSFEILNISKLKSRIQNSRIGVSPDDPRHKYVATFLSDGFLALLDITKTNLQIVTWHPYLSELHA